MRLLLLLSTVFWLSSPATASMIVDRTILTFEAGTTPRQDVTITNPDTDNLYVEVTVLEVSNPGTDEETRTPVKDPETIGLVAAPRKLMVPPGGRRTVRLVNLNGNGDVEKVYRVNFTPVAPPAAVKGMAIRVLVGYQVLIFVAPQKVQSELTSERSGNLLKLDNKGNVNLMLTDGQQCSTPQRDSCVELTGKRLYPGNHLEMDLPGQGPVFFRVTEGETSRVREF